MKYRSTRGTSAAAVSSMAAVIKGLAPDGGLYVPLRFPQPELKIKDLAKMTYQETALMVLTWFFDDYPAEMLKSGVDAAYGKQWDQPSIAPLSAGDDYLELYHGPTLAFKDVALQMLPQLMAGARRLLKIGNEIVILTATSGDTGTASMRGFGGVDKTRVIVFYPDGGVSPVQLKQMLSQEGDNLRAIAVEGNFDDAQTEVKRIFNDQLFGQQMAAAGFQFSSANSMNIGRLVPQISYYFFTYGQLLHRGRITPGQAINFAVPTGNFGDILAGYYARKLGLPIKKLICASNANNVLTDFFRSGKYNKRREFVLTNAPAMDILVSSNLERLLFDAYGQDSQAVRDLMEQLRATGYYQVSSAVHARLGQTFAAGWASEKEVCEEIKRVYEEKNYVIDPHTAVASFVARQYQHSSHDQTPLVVVSTASPYKFPETVYESLTGEPVAQKGLPAVKQLHELLGGQLTAGVQALFTPTKQQEETVAPGQMEERIAELLGLNE